MPLTPEDVANKQFTSTRLKPGYDETEVDEFLDEVEAELTRLYRENDELRSKLARRPRRAAPRPAASRQPHRASSWLRDRGCAEAGRQPAPLAEAANRPPRRLRPHRRPPPSGGNASETATGILALAQRTADEHVAEARTQADRIIGEARTRADQLKREAEDKHRQMIGSLENERVTLEREVEKLRTFEREYRSRLKSYLESQLRELDGRERPEAPSGQQRRVSGQPGQGGQPARAASPVRRRAARSPRVPRWAAASAPSGVRSAQPQALRRTTAADPRLRPLAAGGPGARRVRHAPAVPRGSPFRRPS